MNSQAERDPYGGRSPREIPAYKYGSLINASREGQLAMKALLDAHLKRIDRDWEAIRRP